MSPAESHGLCILAKLPTMARWTPIVGRNPDSDRTTWDTGRDTTIVDRGNDRPVARPGD
jgi:hypothetical protein